MVVPYPPGIPVIMPGGSGAPPATRAIVDYLTALQEFDSRFPGGFENEVHGGVDVVAEDGQRVYYIYCVAE